MLCTLSSKSSVAGEILPGPLGVPLLHTAEPHGNACAMAKRKGEYGAREGRDEATRTALPWDSGLVNNFTMSSTVVSGKRRVPLSICYRDQFVTPKLLKFNIVLIKYFTKGLKNHLLF